MLKWSGLLRSKLGELEDWGQFLHADFVRATLFGERLVEGVQPWPLGEIRGFGPECYLLSLSSDDING